jgi:virginiamycin B lyase
MAATPDGNLWFATRFQAGRVTPAGGFSMFPLPGLDAASSTIQLDLSPGVIQPVAGRDGAVWFPKPLWSQTEVGRQKFVRVTPGGVISAYDLPTNTSIAQTMDQAAAGPDGAIWYVSDTAQSGTSGPEAASQVGRIATDGAITEFPIPMADAADPQFAPVGAYSRASGIIASADGGAWFSRTLSSGEGVFHSSIGRVPPSGGALTTFPLARAMGESVSSMVSGPDGNLWFAMGPSSAVNVIARITPGGELTVFPLPALGASRIGDLTKIVVGPDGNLWFTRMIRQGDGGASRIGRITPAGVIAEFPLPPGADRFRIVADMAAGPDGNLWFAEVDGDGGSVRPSIGRVTPAGDITEFAPPNGRPQLAEGLPTILAGAAHDLWFTYGDTIGHIKA